jgi:transcriptional regulator with XRE-family HTH domain
MPRPRKETVGQRIKRYREERGMTATQLAENAEISKSYISELEASPDDARGPSANVLYRIANALGVAMSDLLGRPIITDKEHPRPASLTRFAEIYKVPEADLRMLERIQFRGEAPKTAERWMFIYQAIKNSAAIDG